jgi:hypothetical protein
MSWTLVLEIDYVVVGAVIVAARVMIALTWQGVRPRRSPCSAPAVAALVYPDGR